MAGGATGGQAKWEAKAPTMDANYQAAKGRMTSGYQTGCQQAGIPVGPRTLAAYQAGISRASISNVQGKGQKWHDNYLRGMSQ